MHIIYRDIEQSLGQSTQINIWTRRATKYLLPTLWDLLRGRIQKKTWCMGPYAGMYYNLALCTLQSRLKEAVSTLKTSWKWKFLKKMMLFRSVSFCFALFRFNRNTKTGCFDIDRNIRIVSKLVSVSVVSKSNTRCEGHPGQSPRGLTWIWSNLNWIRPKFCESATPQNILLKLAQISYFPLNCLKQIGHKIS